jgi:hypothetical protein
VFSDVASYLFAAIVMAFPTVRAIGSKTAAVQAKNAIGDGIAYLVREDAGAASVRLSRTPKTRLHGVNAATSFLVTALPPLGGAAMSLLGARSAIIFGAMIGVCASPLLLRLDIHRAKDGARVSAA